ncbi:MAG: EamA family transporter [Saprospiraceae bacterium]|nr:EamA family transporter [Saprospiraceae bacterium]
MFILILCVLLNSFIGVIFKLFDRYKIENLQAIVVNYYICVLTAAVTIQSNPIPESLFYQPWIWHSMILGLLFILVFNVMAVTVQKTGVIMATIFQKMSLLAPAIIAIVWYNEHSGFSKISGIIIAIVAIILMSYSNIRKEDKTQIRSKSDTLIYPILTFLGSCLIDSAVFITDKKEFVKNGDTGFVASLFLFAAITGTFYLAYQIISGKTRLKLKNIIAGICLGIPNYFSIYLLFMALQQGLEGSVVFPVNNAGVLLLSSFYGILIFREKINNFKIAGFILAMLSIFLITT